jgi:hypothetical protein
MVLPPICLGDFGSAGDGYLDEVFGSFSSVHGLAYGVVATTYVPDFFS